MVMLVVTAMLIRSLCGDRLIGGYNTTVSIGISIRNTGIQLRNGIRGGYFWGHLAGSEDYYLGIERTRRVISSVLSRSSILAHWELLYFSSIDSICEARQQDI